MAKKAFVLVQPVPSAGCESPTSKIPASRLNRGEGFIWNVTNEIFWPGSPEEFSDWRSPSWRSVYVLVTLALGEYGAIDRSADPKGKLQLTVS
jgi:hypothetical protein